MRARVVLAAVAALLLVVTEAGAANRYGLVHGCYALTTAGGEQVAKVDGGYAAGAGAGEPFRMQATRLGEYLFFGKAGDFMAADGDGAVVTAAEPSAGANWRVEERGAAFRILLPAQERSLAVGDGGRLVLGGAPATFRFKPADGCARFPESQVNVSGAPYKGAAPWAQTRGFIDPHFHWMAFESFGGRFHCGRPWHPFGIAEALVDCPEHGPNGSAAVGENLASGSPAGSHDPDGWPTFAGWPKSNSQTHEGAYYRWVERAWRGGLRIATVLLVDNAILCEVYPYRRLPCDEMASIRLQARDVRALENYVDAQSGGPGKGWLRVVTNPFQARRVINQGKLAIVLGIETSRLFHCRELNGDYECDMDSIDRELDRVHKMGVRQMEIVNKYDNALTGVAGDDGTDAHVTNNGNKVETGHYWRMRRCQNLPDDVHDKAQPTSAPEDPLFADVFANYMPSGETPVYPPGPHCNEAGLTPLGKHLLRRMIAKGMLFDPDHMSVKGRLQALEIMEDQRHSGVLSSHSWSTPDAYPRIYRLGGLVTPISGRTEGFVQEWRRLKPRAAPKYYWGFGVGTDIHGLHDLPAARNPADDAVTYPFKTFDRGATVFRNTAGEKTWDINQEGMAHYGLLPDWIEDLRKVGGDGLVRDMARGSEAFLQMWERAVGVNGDRCLARRARLTRRGLGRIRLGATPKALLRRAGQPKRRSARFFAFCVDDTGRRVRAGLGRRGRVRLVASPVRGHRAGRVRPGARRAGSRLIVRRAGPERSFVYVVRNGRVRYVAVTGARRARHAVRAAGL